MYQRTSKGLNWHDFAILYRTNAQSRSMEEALRKQGTPYKIYGGLSFYQRKEIIKDLIAYFRLTFNPADEQALKTGDQLPAHGALAIPRSTGSSWLPGQHNLTPWEVILNPAMYLDGRTSASISNFATMIQSFQVITKTLTAYEAALHIAQHSGLLKDLYEDKSVEGLNRYENIQELLNGIKEFSEREDIEDKGLDVFMQDVALLTNDDKDNNPDADTVSLMTIHSSKGLEFPHVFVVGLEENLFPPQMALNSRSDLEEERRLFYVASTRAENKLTFSYATSRFKFGTLISCEPSRFLDEVDAQYLELDFTAKPAASNNPFFDDERNAWTSRSDTFSKPKPPVVKTTSILAKAHTPSAGFAPSDTSKLQVGMEVEHERFGFGKVISLEGNKPDVKATIFFKEIGQKQLLLKFAKLHLL